MNYILYNPLSNNGKAGGSIIPVCKHFEKEEITKIDYTKLDDFGSFTANITANDTIIIIGGDGTLNHFVNDFAEHPADCKVLFYSAGTGNDFRKDISENEDKEFIELNPYIKNLPTVTIDGKTTRFINGIGYGIDGYCCEEGDIMRAKSSKPVNYTSIAIKGLLYKFKPRNAKITVDGVTKKYKRVWLAPTMLGRYFGGGMKVTPNQDRLNEEHTVSNCVMFGRGRIITLVRFPKIFKGDLLQYTEMVETRTGHEVTVEFSTPCPLQIDGETVLNVKKYTVKYN